MQSAIDILRSQLTTARLVAQALARENAALHARLASATAAEGNALATLARLAAVKH